MENFRSGKDILFRCRPLSRHSNHSVKGSPIKRSSVKENTSPGQGNHRFLAEVQRLCCVQPPSEPFLRLCRDVSRVVSVDLPCTSPPHWSFAVTRDSYKASFVIIRSVLGSET